MDITTIPTDELEQDLLESLQDIAVCEAALILGATTYSGGSIQERQDSNKHFVEVITAELKRRKAQ